MRTLNDGGNDDSNNSKHGSSKNSLVSLDTSRDGDFSNSEHNIPEDSHVTKEKRAIDDSGNFEQDSFEASHDKPDNKKRKKEKIILKLSTKYEKNNEGM